MECFVTGFLLSVTAYEIAKRVNVKKRTRKK